MKSYPIHKGKVAKGKISFFNLPLFVSHLKCLEGKHINIILRLPSKARSIPQNARHWARMTLAAELLGDRTPEELHYDLCGHLLKDTSVNPPRIRTSSELTTEQFTKFEEDIDRVLAELGIVLPDPDDVDLGV